MRVFALLAHYDETPHCLMRLVKSCEQFADYFIAVDGSYQSWPNPSPRSPADACEALHTALDNTEMDNSTYTPLEPWAGHEVEKRAFMFECTRQCGATPDDWLLIIDGDMSVAKVEHGARYMLEDYPYDTAEVRIDSVRPDGTVFSTLPSHRSMYRAVEGLTCKWAHYLYVQPLAVGYRHLFLTPAGHKAERHALDLTSHVTLHHHHIDRTAEREAAARAYYRTRDAQQLERAPHP